MIRCVGPGSTARQSWRSRRGYRDVSQTETITTLVVQSTHWHVLKCDCRVRQARRPVATFRMSCTFVKLVYLESMINNNTAYRCGLSIKNIGSIASRIPLPSNPREKALLQVLLPKSNCAIIRRDIIQFQQLPRDEIVYLQVIESRYDRNLFFGATAFSWQSVSYVRSSLLYRLDTLGEGAVSYENRVHVFVIPIVAVIAEWCIPALCFVPSLTLVRDSPADSVNRNTTVSEFLKFSAAA